MGLHADSFWRVPAFFQNMEPFWKKRTTRPIMHLKNHFSEVKQELMWNYFHIDPWHCEIHFRLLWCVNDYRLQIWSVKWRPGQGKWLPVKGTSAVPVLAFAWATGDMRGLVPLDRGLSASGSAHRKSLFFARSLVHLLRTAKKCSHFWLHLKKYI